MRFIITNREVEWVSSITPVQEIKSVTMDTASAHSSLTHQIYARLQDLRREENVEIDGESLDIPTVVAVS